MIDTSDEGRGARARALEDAALWLQKILADGPVPVREIECMAREAGRSMRTLKRAKARLGIESVKDSVLKGRWSWVLPRRVEFENSESRV